VGNSNLREDDHSAFYFTANPHTRCLSRCIAALWRPSVIRNYLTEAGELEMNNPADEMAAKTEPTDQLLDIILEKKQAGRHRRAALTKGLRDTDKLPHSPTSRGRNSRGIALAICVGIAAAFAWQSYGDAIKQITARAPELGWSAQAKQMIASWTLSWTKPLGGPEKITPEAVAPKAPPAPSLEPAQVRQSLPALREPTGQIAADQHQASGEIARRRRHRRRR
jgi:hypothetical protein